MTWEAMFGVGLREWVGLGVLGVAALFGFLFFDPTSTDGGTQTPGTISLGDTPTPTPVVTPTATPVPITRLTEPAGGWLVVYFEAASSGGELRTGEGFDPTLDFDFPDRPFPDIRDDAWRLEASQDLDLEPGRYRFTLETDGEVRAWAGETQIMDESDSLNPRRSELQFDHPGGRVTLKFSVKDTGGPFVLRWMD